MDVYDNPASDRVIATFEIPGVRSNDVGLSIQEGSLIIEGRRRCPMEHCGATAITATRPAIKTEPSDPDDSMPVDGDEQLKIRASVKELRFGDFHRAVPLPIGVKVSTCFFKARPHVLSLYGRWTGVFPS